MSALAIQIEEIQQNTPEWEEMRKGKIGASDAPIIMNVSPWKTPMQLWEEKSGFVPQGTQTFFMKRGHHLEQKAREKLEEMTGVLFQSVVRVHPEFEWMIASLDALSLDNAILAEIKCPGKEDHKKAMEGEVPEKYFPQLQHQMEVCGVDKAIYFSFDGENGVIVEVKKDEKYVADMLKKEKNFYECMKSLKPPSLTDKDHQLINSFEWESTAKQWTETNRAIKELQEKEKELRDNLIGLSQHHSSKGGGITLTKVVRKGNVKYSDIPELKNVCLDQYRGDAIESWRITEEKKYA